MRVFRSLALVALCVCGVPALHAQGADPVRPAAPQGMREIPVDRVVAVVGQKPILESDVLEAVGYARAQGAKVPEDSAGFIKYWRKTLEDLIDQEILIAAARLYKADVPETDIAPQVERHVKGVRARFNSELEFREALKREGMGSEAEFRKTITEQITRNRLQQIGFDSLRAHGRMAAPVSVTEEDVTAAYEKAKASFPKRPATISFRQIVIPTRPSAAERQAALTKADSLLADIKKGADFEKLAKRESMDPGSKELGGDLGWNRRGHMVPEFDRVMFGLSPGQVAPTVVETVFGFHIIRVDRVQPAEVKARHILIMPALDSADVARARAEADTVLRLWKAGTPYDTLVAHHHDNSEIKSYPDAYFVDSLPPAYQKAIEGVKAGGFTQPFEIPDPRTGKPKFGIVQITDRVEGGDFTLADKRDQLRQELQYERATRRMLDELRKEQFVVVRM